MEGGGTRHRAPERGRQKTQGEVEKRKQQRERGRARKEKQSADREGADASQTGNRSIEALRQ